MLLDELMPEYLLCQIHRILIDTPTERALEAAKRVTLGDMPLVRLLSTIRSLPGILARGGGLPTTVTEPLFAQMMDSGFIFLGEEQGREVVVGAIGQMWQPRGGLSLLSVRDGRGFVAFDEPGYAKAAMNFFVEPRYGGTVLRTETRVLTTDAASRRKFGLYWKVIHPGSAAIRRSWLRAAKRRAECLTMGLCSKEYLSKPNSRADAVCRVGRPEVAENHLLNSAWVGDG